MGRKKKISSNLTSQGVRNLDILLGKRPPVGRKVDLEDIPPNQFCKHPKEARKSFAYGRCEECTICGEQFEV